jgi:hypothetical protein
LGVGVFGLAGEVEFGVAEQTVRDRTNARLVFGHDADVLTELKQEPFYD